VRIKFIVIFFAWFLVGMSSYLFALEDSLTASSDATLLDLSKKKIL